MLKEKNIFHRRKNIILQILPKLFLKIKNSVATKIFRVDNKNSGNFKNYYYPCWLRYKPVFSCKFNGLITAFANFVAAIIPITFSTPTLQSIYQKEKYKMT